MKYVLFTLVILFSEVSQASIKSKFYDFCERHLISYEMSEFELIAYSYSSRILQQMEDDLTEKLRRYDLLKVLSKVSFKQIDRAKRDRMLLLAVQEELSWRAENPYVREEGGRDFSLNIDTGFWSIKTF